MPTTTMSPRLPTRRAGRRVSTLVAALAMVAVLAGGCVGQRDPTGYSASVREDFVAGCTQSYAAGHKGKDPEAKHHTELCGCVYDQMSNKTTGIPFDEFKSAQSKIRKDPASPANSLDKLIPKFGDFVDTCNRKTRVGP